ncbi:uncharacterized protein BP5553_00197 [Venustampulla echinocandica]|uniref:2EXR domain-containing protein n=1 Tax=Venustampulla echinocandica TaxID=2656787 RepID=A0A370TXK4_9HELO|nr:uncharacterized protein BP5553_00197 [Venustampulla echinocandica]RDL40218.1 hypothetical protein BP5553_00197 [Venustampulla echinocandica]
MVFEPGSYRAWDVGLVPQSYQYSQDTIHYGMALQAAATARDSYVQPAQDAVPAFRRFSNLSIELRYMIWKLALPSARVIKVTYGVFQQDQEDGSIIEFIQGVTDAQTPTLLHVNHESRRVALKNYKLCFEEEFRYPIYVDIRRDVIMVACMEAVDILLNVSPTNIFKEGQLRMLAIDFRRTSRQSRSNWRFDQRFQYSSSLSSGPIGFAKLGCFDEIVLVESFQPPPGVPNIAPIAPMYSHISDNVGQFAALLNRHLNNIQHTFNVRRNRGLSQLEFKRPTITVLTNEELLDRMS